MLLSVPETTPTISRMRRLWVHEVLRVFGDRLIDQTDISWLVKEIRVTLTNRMFIDIDDLFEDLIISREKVNFFLISFFNIF